MANFSLLLEAMLFIAISDLMLDISRAVSDLDEFEELPIATKRVFKARFFFSSETKLL